MDDEDLVQVVQAYASLYGLGVRERPGSGIHGIVHVVESKTDPGRRALELHRDSDAYLREKTICERFSEKRIDAILAFDIPEPPRFDDEFMAIENSILESSRRHGIDLIYRGSFLIPSQVFLLKARYTWRFLRQEKCIAVNNRQLKAGGALEKSLPPANRWAR